MINSARYMEDGNIHAVVDGVEMTIPDKMGNRHRQMIAEWEDAGNVIAPYVVPSPDRVSARQFKMQLFIDGYDQEVNAWVAQQDPLVQIAFANSAEFVKSEPMLQAGMAALGY